jgi:hypothetical protein
MESNANFISFNWKRVDCGGPPDVILGLESLEDNSIIETILQDGEFEKCRYKQAIINGDECCRTSLDLSLPYLSIGGTADKKFPQLANGHEYCLMKINGNSSSSTLEITGDASSGNSTAVTGNSTSETSTGYTSKFIDGYFLGGGDSCLEERIKCKDGNLEIYPVSGCTGTPEVFTLSAALTSFTSLGIQSFQAQKLTITSGVSQYKWVTFFPQGLYAPLNNNAMEIFGTLLQILTLSISYIALIYYSYHIFRGTGKSIYKAFVFSHLIWLIYVSIDIYTQYLLTDNYDFLAIVACVSFIFKHLAMLVTVFISAYSLMTIVYVTSLGQKIWAFVGIGLLHLALTGGEYLAYFQLEFPVLNDWASATAIYFTVFMFVFDSAVTLLVTSKIVRAYAGRPLSLKESVLTALKEFSISSYVIVQSLLMLLYFLSYCAVRYTVLLGNDRGDSTIQYGLHNFILSLHAIIASMCYDNFAKLLQKLKQDSFEKKKKILMEESTDAAKCGYNPSFGLDMNFFPESVVSHSDTGTLNGPFLGNSFSSGVVTRGNTAKSTKSTSSSKPNPTLLEFLPSNSGNRDSQIRSYDILESFVDPQPFNPHRLSGSFVATGSNPSNIADFSAASPQIQDSDNILLARFSNGFSDLDPFSP